MLQGMVTALFLTSPFVNEYASADSSTAVSY